MRRQGRTGLNKERKKCQKGTLRQAPGVGRPATTSTVHPISKKKLIHRLAEQTLYLSPSSSSPLLSTNTGINQDSIGLPSVEVNPNRELELMVPCIILEPKGNEEEAQMTPNLRASFKER